MLFVSPSYLIEDAVPVQENFLDEMLSLQKNQFGLLMPKDLEENSEEIAQVSKDIVISDYGVEANPNDLEVIIGYLPSDWSAFLYNQEAIPADQWLNETIIVVLTPHSIGYGTWSNEMWTDDISSSLFLQDASETIHLLQKHEVFPWTSYVTNSYSFYNQQTENYRNETISLLAGSLIGLATAIISFYAMNTLYFRQFRKEIFIRRISGRSFLRIHEDYLKSLALILLLSAVLNQYITQNWLISISAYLIFIVLEIIILSRQMKKANTALVTEIKGE